MKFKTFSQSLICFVLLAVILEVGCTTGNQKEGEYSESAKTESTRPNIVLIMVDDLGFSDLGCYGGEIKTPHIDKLASQGLRFTQFYNAAVCVPTRKSLLFGLYDQRTEGREVFPDGVNIGQVLKTAGYQTGIIGKWHIGSPNPDQKSGPFEVSGAGGFDESFLLWGGAFNYFNPAQTHPDFHNKQIVVHNGQKLSTEDFPEGYYVTDGLADRAIETIRRFDQSDDPFFLNLNFNSPHYPIHAKPEDIRKYKGMYDDGYSALREERYQRLIELGLIDKEWDLPGPDKQIENVNYDYQIIPWNEVPNPERQRRRMEVYAGMVDAIDQAVGRVLEAIEETGKADNTLVMFLSDNGGCASISPNHDQYLVQNQEGLPGPADTYDFVGPGWGWGQSAPFRRYKLWTYEGGISTPMIIRWPNVVGANAITHQVGHVIDIMPTLVDLAGAHYPSNYQGRDITPMDGLSILPILKGKERKGHDRLYWAVYGNRAVRQGRWKLVWGFTAREWELYDMVKDRTETNNLASTYPERVEEMSQAWESWYDQMKGSTEKN